MAGYIGSKASVVSSGAERKKTFAITTTTTVLSGLSYTPTFVHLFHNGVRLVDGTDYTATDGTSITLTSAAESGDEVVVISYATFQAADAYTKAEADVGFVSVAGDTMTGGLTVGGPFTSKGIDDNAAATAMTIDSSGSVGIGATANNDLPLNVRSTYVYNGVNNGAIKLNHYLSSDENVQQQGYLENIGYTGIWHGSRYFGGGNRIMDGVSTASSGVHLQGNGNIDFYTRSGVTAGSSFGTAGAKRMSIDSSGRVTMPYQPAFDVSYSGSGYTTSSTVVFDTVYTNVGGHYSTSNGRFTAPVSGSYIFYTSYIKNNSNTVARRRFDRNGSQASNGRHLRKDEGQQYGDNGVLQSIIYCNAGDYVTVDQYAGSSHGTHAYDYFGGYLIG